MSSPAIRKNAISPIRNLDDKSPRRRLHPILQEQTYSIRPNISITGPLERQNTTLNIQNKALNDKIRNYAEETTQFLLENNRLKQQNQTLRELSYTSNAYQIDKLSREVYLKDAEIQRLRNDLVMMKAHYERNLSHYQLETDSLKSQLLALENRRYSEVEDIKHKYTAAAQEDMNLARKGYYDDITRLMTNLQANKALLAQKEIQIKHLTNHSQNLVKQHSSHLQQLVTENNILRNQILQIEIKRDNEVKQAENKKQLQKSRTHGIITFCKQNSAFMQKQINKLAEQLLQKSISIQQFTKDMLKIKRNLQQTEKRYQDKIYKIQADCDQKLLQKDRQVQKADKHHKQELADMKKIQMELQQTIATREHQLDSLARQNEHNKQIIRQKNRQIEQMKQNLSKMHEDHAKQISKVMTDSRIKRKSMKNLSSSSSLRDLSADGSAIIKKPLARQNSIVEGHEGSSGQLYTVQQQMVASKLVHNQEDDQQIAMKDLILHYQNIIQQLKNNKALQQKLANQKISKLNQSLRQKQQQVLQILQRFSPLMQYRLNSSSLDQQRKQKIQKHYRANIDLLSVMLQKNGISALARKK